LSLNKWISQERKDIPLGSVNYTYKDEFTWEEAVQNTENELRTVFKDGTLIKEQTLNEVRHNLHGGTF